MPFGRPTAVTRRQRLVVAVFARGGRPRAAIAPWPCFVAPVAAAASAPSTAPPLPRSIVVARRPFACGGAAFVVGRDGLAGVGGRQPLVEIGLQVIPPGIALGGIVSGTGQAAGTAPGTIAFAARRLTLPARGRLSSRPAVIAPPATTAAAASPPAPAAGALARTFGVVACGPRGTFPALALRLLAARGRRLLVERLVVRAAPLAPRFLAAVAGCRRLHRHAGLDGPRGSGPAARLLTLRLDAKL